MKHHAVTDANTSRYADLASSGVGTTDCIRHNLKCPKSCGNLQKGEAYKNMDYLFFSNLSNTDFTTLVMSYDIVCQWSVNLWDRMAAYPRHLHIDKGQKKITFLVPKFHLPAHVSACQTAFSFNLTPGVGRTDGEAPERGWANINPLSAQTKGMGPASQRETIDDHFGDWNHQKVTGLGKLHITSVKYHCSLNFKGHAFFASSKTLSQTDSSICSIFMSLQIPSPPHLFRNGKHV